MANYINRAEYIQLIGLNSWLPSPEILQGCIQAIIQAFENVGEMEVMKIRWEEIKKLQVQPIFT